MKIDDGCGVVCFLLSSAYINEVIASSGKSQSDELGRSIERLQFASTIAQRALVDPELTSEVSRSQKQIHKMLVITRYGRLIQTFNELMESVQKHGFLSIQDFDEYGQRFLSIRAELAHLQPELSSIDANVGFEQLAQFIDSNLQQISKAREQAMDYQAVNEVIQKIDRLRQSLEKYGVRSETELNNYEKEFRVIRNEANRLRRLKSSEEAGTVLSNIIQWIDDFLNQGSDIRSQLKLRGAIEDINAIKSRLDHKTYRSQSELDKDRHELQSIHDNLPETKDHTFGLRRLYDLLLRYFKK